MRRNQRSPNALGMLVGVALLVLLAVFGLGRWLLGTTANVDGTEGEPTTEGEGPEMTIGQLDITGDVVTTLVFEGEGAYQAFKSTDSLNLGEVDVAMDATQGAYIDEVHLPGMDFFLEPSDCDMQPAEAVEKATVVVDISCSVVTDIHQNHTISMEGAIRLPVDFVERPPVELGGTLVVSDDMSLEAPIQTARWTDADQGSVIYFNGWFGDFGFATMTLRADPGGPFRLDQFAAGDEFWVGEESDCSVTTDLVAEQEEVSVWSVTVDCPRIISDQGTTISVSGAIATVRVAVPETPITLP